MKFITAIATTVALLLASACAGTKARENVLLPAMRQAYVGVSQDVKSGIPLAVNPRRAEKIEAQFASALAEGNIELLRATDWHSLESLAIQGVAKRVTDGDLSPSAGRIILRRLALFTDGYVKLVAR